MDEKPDFLLEEVDRRLVRMAACLGAALAALGWMRLESTEAVADPPELEDVLDEADAVEEDARAEKSLLKICALVRK